MFPPSGAALDNGNSGNDYWKPLFDGFGPAREWIAQQRPDVCIVVYNDHASAFSLDTISTFSIGVGAGSNRRTRAMDRARYPR
jgi:protocatechuate 4,5-dioxygenase, beta chain